jgi:hypothetical protein
MDVVSSSVASNGNRVLILSNRNIQNFVFNSCLYEFEDTISRLDTVDLIAPNEYDLYGKIIKKLVKTSSNCFQSAVNLNPYRKSIDLQQEYDIFLVILDFPWSISSLNLLKKWRNKCKFAVCYLIELWETDLKRYRNCLQFLNEFDALFLGHAHIVEKVSQIVNRPCQYLPPGINTLKFVPKTLTNQRSIDLCSLGRRSLITHQALLSLAETQNFFYYFDLAGDAGLTNNLHQQHRTLTANLLKNSRYFITNHAKANLPDRINGQMEIGYRFFEGAAAGTVMLGCPPQNKIFDHYFDWQDATIPIAFDEPNIGEIITKLERQPSRIAKIRQQNIYNSLLRHDWSYRWQEILAVAGLKLSIQHLKHQDYLQELALSLEGGR